MAKRRSTASLRRGTRFGAWTLTRRLGQGGNGQVWEVSGEDGTRRAIKLLDPSKGSGRYRLARFRDEVRFLIEHPGRPGVLPLIDNHLSDHPTEASWYVMPTATPIREALGDDPSPEAVVGAIASIAGTLAALGTEGIGHRDIKPDNLFKLDNEWVVGDFGLVTYPEKDPLTEHGRRLGPVDFMAPEMRQDADYAHAEAADVWAALAKTLWALLLNQAYPLPGPHRPTDPAYALHRRTTYVRAPELDLLLERATVINPASREPMAWFARELRACLAPPPEATASASLQALQDRITTLTTAPYQQLSDSQERRRRVNRAFEGLKEEGLREAYHALGQRLVHFQSRYHDDVTDAAVLLDRKGLSYASYTWGAQFVSPTSTPRVVVTIAVAARVMQEDSPAEFAAVLTVERRQDNRANVHEVWRGNYVAPVASAQQAHVFAEIRAGFLTNLDETLHEVAEMLATTDGAG